MSPEQSARAARYSPSLRRSWADALELANLQVEVLTQLHEADGRADDVGIQRCVAALDHVMAQVADAERVRRRLSGDPARPASDADGASDADSEDAATMDAATVDAGPEDAGPEDADDAATVDEPTCIACGTLTQPVYDAPRLLGYRCPRCDWTADDPMSQAAQRLDAAKDAAVEAARKASDAIAAALVNVRERRKKQQHERGLRDLEAAVANLDTVAKRVTRAEQQLRAARRDAGKETAGRA